MPRAGDERADAAREMIARNIRLARRYKGMPPTQLAYMAGVSAESLRKWETGARSPEASILVVLAEVLEITPAELFAETPPSAWLKEESRYLAAHPEESDSKNGE